MKRIIKVIAALLGLFLIVGCRDIGRESAPNERSFISAVGIDREGDEWHLTVETAAAGEQGGKTLGGKGDDLFSAMSNITAASSGDLLFTHCRAVVFGEKIVGELFSDALSFCKNELNLPLSVRLISAKSAAELLSSETGGRGYEISDITDNTADMLGFGAHAALYEIETARLIKNSVFALPYFAAEDNIQIKGLAVYRGKDILRLDKNESVAYALLRNIFEGGDLSYKEKSERVTAASSKITATLNENRLEITVKIQGESELLTELVRDTLSKWRIDLFGIEESIKRQEPSLYEEIKNDFESYFRNAKITVEEE